MVAKFGCRYQTFCRWLLSVLQPLPIPDGKFHTGTIDFNTDLPESNGYNALMVVVDKFGKLSWLLPCRSGES